MTSEDRYAEWLVLQRTAKIAAKEHGWDSEAAERARERADAAFAELWNAIPPPERC